MIKCRFCGNDIKHVINFGLQPIANNFVSSLDDDLYRFELDTYFCPNCKLFQLKNQPRPDLMFHDRYTFFTGLSDRMTKHFSTFASQSLADLNKDFAEVFVVEIGSNDGTLLKNIANLKIKHLGVDPSANVVEVAQSKGVTSMVAFFGSETADLIVQSHGRADLVLAANVICHIPDINDFARGIEKLLAEGGRFIFEEPYAGDVLEKTSYDQFYDEHVYIFSCTSVKNIFQKFGLDLVDAIPQATHGGSMRYVIAREGERPRTERCEKALFDEEKNGLNDFSSYAQFAKNCEIRKNELVNLLNELKAQGKIVAGYAATSKSTTVLNYCGIGRDLISYISDSTPEKQGRLTPGTYIPIVTPEELRSLNPDYLVLFAWNHEKEILEKELALTAQGVRWIRFVPQIEILQESK